MTDPRELANDARRYWSYDTPDAINRLADAIIELADRVDDLTNRKDGKSTARRYADRQRQSSPSDPT